MLGPLIHPKCLAKDVNIFQFCPFYGCCFLIAHCSFYIALCLFTPQSARPPYGHNDYFEDYFSALFAVCPLLMFIGIVNICFLGIVCLLCYYTHTHAHAHKQTRTTHKTCTMQTLLVLCLSHTHLILLRGVFRIVALKLWANSLKAMFCGYSCSRCLDFI